MSYQQKYLKYKSKYLALKSQATPMTKNKNTTETNLSNLVQLGGSSINNKTNNIEQLTATPSLTEIWGGSFSAKSKTDISNLVNLLNESEDIVTTEFSLTGGSESVDSELSQSDSEDIGSENKSDDSSSSSESASAENKSESEIPKADVIADSNDDEKKDDSDSEVKETAEGEMLGGKKKPNSYKKFFFEDSDIVQSSTTSDSDLSSFNTSTTEDSDADL